MLCLEKFANIDVFEVVLLPAIKQKIFTGNCNSQTVLSVVLPINF